MGAWVTYGLGSESQNLPGFVVLQSGPRGPRGGASLWASGFLPTSFQGVPFRSSGEPIAYLTPPKNVTISQQRARLDLLKQWNEEYAAANPAESSLAARPVTVTGEIAAGLTPARLKASSDSSIAFSPSIQPLAPAALIIEYSPDTW